MHLKRASRNSEIESSAHEQCVTRCSDACLVRWDGPVSVMTGKISIPLGCHVITKLIFLHLIDVSRKRQIEPTQFVE